MSGKQETGDNTTLTEAQTKFLASMMQNCKTKPDVDWDKVAAEFKMTSKSARERYRILAIKLGWNKSEGSGSDCPATPKKPAGVTKRTGKVGDSAKKSKGGKKATKQQVDMKEEEDELAAIDEV